MKRLVFLVTSLLFSGFSFSQSLTLEDIYLTSKFAPNYLTGTKWVPGRDAYTWLEPNKETGLTDILLMDCKSGEKSVLIPGSALKNGENPFNTGYHEWTSDGKYLLLSGLLEARSVKTGGELGLYSVDAKTFTVIPSEGAELKIARLSPDGKTLGYVKNNNLFLYELSGGKETQITFDGTDQILNGNFDWVYEEEFSIINGWEWSPDSKKIAFWRLDQTQVPQFKISLYTQKYLDFNEYKYPKAGDPNSSVKIGIFSTETGKTVWADTGNDREFYIPRMKWTRNSSLLSIQKLNRRQDKLELLLTDAESGKSRVILTETGPAWVEVHDNLTFLKDGKSFLWTSEKDGFNHLYLYDLSGKEIRQLTSGNWEVDQVFGADQEQGWVYFSSGKEALQNSDLFRVPVSGGKISRLTSGSGYHSISFHPQFSWYIDRYSAAETPAVTSLFTPEGKLTRVLLEAKSDPVKTLSLPIPEFRSIPGADGTPLAASILKPSDFDSTKKYPVLFFVYGGPGSQLVLNVYAGQNYYWHSLLTQKGYIVVTVDNRGTNGRGYAFRTSVYKNLGKKEVEDQIAAANWMASQSWVDAGRIGIWGWSYGGFMSALALFTGTEVYKAAISVAPVTDWKFYDSIYTERFMLSPSENQEGYAYSPLSMAKNLKGNLLLIHGTADDNVHFQNSIELVRELQAQGKQFETMYYPDRYHGIQGGKSRYHLFSYMTRWLEKNL